MILLWDPTHLIMYQELQEHTFAKYFLTMNKHFVKHILLTYKNCHN